MTRSKFTKHEARECMQILDERVLPGFVKFGDSESIAAVARVQSFLMDAFLVAPDDREEYKQSTFICTHIANTNSRA